MCMEEKDIVETSASPEVEVLEGGHDYTKDIPALATIAEVTDKNSQAMIMVNGVAYPVVHHLVHCPKCGRVIVDISNPMVSYSDVCRMCTEAEHKFLNVATYCPACGQRLRYAREEPIDAEVSEKAAE